MSIKFFILFVFLFAALDCPQTFANQDEAPWTVENYINYCKESVRNRTSNVPNIEFQNNCDNIKSTATGYLVYEILNRYNRIIDLDLFEVFTSLQTIQQVQCIEQRLLPHTNIEVSINDLLDLCPQLISIPVVEAKYQEYRRKLQITREYRVWSFHFF